MLPLIGVHGFGYDPENKRHSPAHLYVDWATHCHSPFRGHRWFSVPPGVSYVLQAWRSGHWNRYTRAWKLAIEEAALLRVTIASFADKHGSDVGIVCHSLGSRVVLEALRRPLPVSRVLILSGADSRDHAAICAKEFDAAVLNVTVDDDGVLGYMGRWFTPKLGPEPVIGRSGLPGAPANWTDYHLEAASDHWDAYEPRFWHEWRRWLHHGELP